MEWFFFIFWNRLWNDSLLVSNSYTIFITTKTIRHALGGPTTSRQRHLTYSWRATLMTRHMVCGILMTCHIDEVGHVNVRHLWHRRFLIKWQAMVCHLKLRGWWYALAGRKLLAWHGDVSMMTWHLFAKPICDPLIIRVVWMSPVQPDFDQHKKKKTGESDKIPENARKSQKKKSKVFSKYRKLNKLFHPLGRFLRIFNVVWSEKSF